jgi:hypothetical protein
MSSDQPSRRPPAKSSGGGAPMGSTISIVIAVVAVVVGFLILRNINDDSGSGAGAGPITTTGTTPESTPSSDITTITTVPGVVTSTTQPLVFSPGKVVVANASGVGGAAGTATKALAGVGFTMGDATDAFGAEKKITQTKVYYQAGSEAVAASVAQAFGAPASGVVVAPMVTPIPVVNATIGDATVLVMLGSDFAGKPLPILAVTAPTTPPAATTVTPAGDTTTSGA